MKLQRHAFLGLVLAALAAFTAPGCNRAYYRRQADRDAYGLVRSKAHHPHWALLEKFSIHIDPRSRMFDPGSPDCPALPQDDPHAHELMHCVDGKRGYPDWHKDGEVDTVENPAWSAYMIPDENGIVQISADDAVRLGFLHSRNYQQEMEEVYLSALDVSFERFRFDSQFFAGYAATYTADGPDRPGAGGNSSSELNLRTFSNGQRSISMQKLFTTGGTLVVGLANQLVWQFSGPNNYTPTTLVDFSLVQPLLRNAGRDRVMERLTVSERTLLANVRAMEQFRQGYYVEVMTGRAAGGGPSRRGGVFGAGLEGFTGVGGGFGRVATTTTAAGGNAGGGQGAGAAAVGGYLGLLQNLQDIRNQEDNILRLRSNLFRLEETLVELRTRTGEEGLVNNILRQDLQVAQARQALFNAESRLLNARNAYQTSVDSFTNTLGLPPTLCIAIRDRLLEPFQLVDPVTYAETRSMDELTRRFGEARQRVIDHVITEQSIDPVDPTITRVVRRLPKYEGLAEDLNELKRLLGELSELRTRLMNEHLPRVHSDLDDFAKARERRKQNMQKIHAWVEAARKEPCPLLPIPSLNQEVFNTTRLDNGLADLRAKLRTLETKFGTAYDTHLDERTARIDAVLERTPDDEEKLFAAIYTGILYPRTTVENGGGKISDIIVDLPGDLLALQLVQARARTERIELAPVDLRWERAIQVADKYRRDLMNARATLVDTWRLIRFNANQLESSLDLVFSGDISNFGQSPINLQSSTGRLRVGLQFDAPLTRLSERNTYRQALIEYQQARRNFYAFEDTVARALRQELRTIAANQINFELQRLAVLEAARQVDRNEDIRIDQELTGQASGATAARDAVSALTDLLDAQNNFMSIWVNYEAQRRFLDLDLGTMQLDPEGIWIDPGEIGQDYGSVDPWDRCADDQKLFDDALPEDITRDLEELPPAEEADESKARMEMRETDMLLNDPATKDDADALPLQPLPPQPMLQPQSRRSGLRQPEMVAPVVTELQLNSVVDPAPLPPATTPERTRYSPQAGSTHRLRTPAQPVSAERVANPFRRE